MSRVVTHKAHGPVAVDCAGKDKVFVCACGLTNKPPLCDGTHAKTRDEAPDKLYAYSKDGTRVEISSIG